MGYWTISWPWFVFGEGDRLHVRPWHDKTWQIKNVFCSISTPSPHPPPPSSPAVVWTIYNFLSKEPFFLIFSGHLNSIRIGTPTTHVLVISFLSPTVFCGALLKMITIRHIDNPWNLKKITENPEMSFFNFFFKILSHHPCFFFCWKRKKKVRAHSHSSQVNRLLEDLLQSLTISISPLIEHFFLVDRWPL